MGEARPGGIVGHLIAASVRTFAADLRGNLLRAGGSALTPIAEAVGVAILMGRFETLAGWDAPSVLVLFGLATAGLGLGMLVAEPLEPPTFSQLLRDGRFDAALTRPLSPWLWVVANDVQIRNLGRVVTGSGIAAYGFAQADARWTATGIGLLVLSVAAMGLVVAAILTVGAAVTLWTVEGTEVLNAFTYGGSSLAGWPLDIYSSALRFIFLWVVPAGTVVYLPAARALGRSGTAIDHIPLLAVPALVATSAAGAALIWQRGLRHHRGAGG